MISKPVGFLNLVTFDYQNFLKTLTTRPGVYQMENAAGEVIYVGKASNLKNRVSSYFSQRTTSIKTKALVEQIAHINTTITANENEALLLESQLIKKFRPKYNILLRDDKSYPYLFVSTEETFPRIEFYRGKKRNKKGHYFGPYPSASAVRETLNTLQKIFKIRSCSPVFFSNRGRPCLQYQIKRCSGPCVGLISPEEYQISLRNAIQFLHGNDQALIHDLEKRMEKASEHRQYEKAAHYRDQIIHLQQIRTKKNLLSKAGNMDILAASFQHGYACIHKMVVRNGETQAGFNFFPSIPDLLPDNEQQTKYLESEILEAFITQYYCAAEHHNDIPSHIIVSHPLSNPEVLENVLTQLREKKCGLSSRVRGIRAEWMKVAIQNSQIALETKLGAQTTIKQRFKALQTTLGLPAVPTYLECFDISHTSGEATIASRVVFDVEGPKKSQYRYFNIEGIQPGDDYAAMRQALFRHYSRLKKDEAAMPDILFIDGGKGQVAQAREVLETLNIRDVQCIGVAKGPSRKAGLETLILMDENNQELKLDPHSPALHLIQHIRDEAHRFAVLGHTNKRDKKRTESVLETIEGIGSKRRQALYRHFGGLQEVKKASAEAIAKIPGISKALAEKIYDALH